VDWLDFVAILERPVFDFNAIFLMMQSLWIVEYLSRFRIEQGTEATVLKTTT